MGEDNKAVYDKVIIKRDEKGRVEFVTIHDTANKKIEVGRFIPLEMDEHLAMQNRLSELKSTTQIDSGEIVDDGK